jgi:hypothetical protein
MAKGTHFMVYGQLIKNLLDKKKTPKSAIKTMG